MEISVVLLDRNVFAFEETIKSRITFTNPSEDKAESLAWASAQIHYSCTLSDVIPSSSQDDASISSNRLITSFQPVLDSGSRDVYASSPFILLADMILEPQDSKVFFFEEKIPHKSNSLPPSYLGHRIKYSYKLIVGTQRVNSSIKMVKIPFRVIQSLSDGSRRALKAREANNKLIVSTKSPFLPVPPEESQEADDDEEEDAFSTYMEGSKIFHHYEIARQTGKLAKLSLFKNAYRIGEEVMGTFEFYDSGIRCVEYSVSLMSEEILEKKGRKLSCHAKCHDVTLGFQFSNLALQIPLHVPPTFHTETCELKWYLHFVFVISSKIPFQKSASPKEDDEWNGPKGLEVETMVWDLPITLIPTSPEVLTSSLLQPFSKRSVVCQI
uniref:Retrograde Golgi transport protein RGP1 homolog n=1 Tax=Caligus rogercresseyi TaxID=217165 RepID=C1BR77_CALRO|nr:Retrograde Golgi transport protein RGP1 homolog [Caligus rogercresseyi]